MLLEEDQIIKQSKGKINKGCDIDPFSFKPTVTGVYELIKDYYQILKTDGVIKTEKTLNILRRFGIED